MRVGVVFPGDGRLRAARSGVPFSLARGLEEAGASVLHLRADLPPPLDRAALNLLTAFELPRATFRGSPRSCRRAAFNGPAIGRLQSRAGRHRVRRRPGLDGIVQVGSSYSLSADGPVVTHDDMTVVQAARAGYPGLSVLTKRQLAARIERQRAAYEQAAACCVVTGWAARSVVEDYGISPEKVHVVGGGRNHEPPVASRDWTTPRFLLVGKDWERKNGPAVLRAFRRLKSEIPEARLDVVGGHPPIDADGVTGHGLLRLDVASERRRVDELFASATCFVMPSRHEPAGLVITEANAAGIPTIGTTEGGSVEFIGDAGRTVHPDDDDALLAAMRELADPATAERLGRRALERAPLFTWRAVGERVLRALGAPDADERPLAAFLNP
jgi:glycosyltransferase involved in cell wall biosynthesis